MTRNENGFSFPHLLVHHFKRNNQRTTNVVSYVLVNIFNIIVILPQITILALSRIRCLGILLYDCRKVELSLCSSSGGKVRYNAVLLLGCNIIDCEDTIKVDFRGDYDNVVLCKRIME